MSAECTSYYSTEKLFVSGFTCPKKEGDANAIFCCGFNDIKYCCDDPNSFFPYEYGYMWWLSVGALIGLSIAAIVLLAFIVTVCVFCYLFIAAKPSRLDSGLPLQAPESIPGCVNASQSKAQTHRHTNTHLLSHPEGTFILGNTGSNASEEPRHCSAPGGPQGFRKHFLSRKLDCDNQPPTSDRIFQRCFLATLPAVNVEGP